MLDNSQLLDYLQAHTSPEPTLLRHISRETHLQVLMPHMVSGHLQGRLLAMLSQMIQPQRILEIGTFTGYSAVCLAEGLAPGGKLITLEVNPELEDRLRSYFEEAGFSGNIKLHIGKALDLIPQLTDVFDLVFIDADKHNYAAYLDLVLEKVRPGGFIVADNVLWKGKVLEENPDKDTRNMQDFNRKVQLDPRLENVLIPLRDGLMLMRKI
jgi:caffeoyl-CoA O-methyltransferase